MKKEEDIYLRYKEPNLDDVLRFMKEPKDITNINISDKANILTLHFIGYFAKPIGIPEDIYRQCLDAFNGSRGKVEQECSAVLEVLRLKLQK